LLTKINDWQEIEKKSEKTLNICWIMCWVFIVGCLNVLSTIKLAVYGCLKQLKQLFMLGFLAVYLLLNDGKHL